MNQIQGWTTVRESYSRALEQGPLLKFMHAFCLPSVRRPSVREWQVSPLGIEDADAKGKYELAGLLVEYIILQTDLWALLP